METEKDVKIDVEMRKIFAHRLKRLRMGKKFTLEELAEVLRNKYKIGATYGSLGNYERSTRIPDLYILSKIAEYFDVSTDYLLGISDEKNAKIVQTTLFDKHNKPHIVEVAVDKNIPLADRPFSEIQDLIKQLKELGFDYHL